MRSARRAATLTHRLLAFSRRQPLDPKPLNLNHLIGNMSDMLQRTLGEAMAIQTTLAGDLWWASADANQLESAILNLAVNARDAMPTRRQADDRDREHRPGRGLLRGNSRRDRRRVHRHRGQRQWQRHGQGAGRQSVRTLLHHQAQWTGYRPWPSQVYGFLKQSGGHAKIYSEEGEGTTVKMYLPRLKGEHHASGDSAADVLPALRSTHAETILVLEDDEDVRAMTCGNLRNSGTR